MYPALAFRSALLAAPLCLALAPIDDDVTFHPKDGSQVTKTFANSFELGVDDLSMMVNGADMSEMMPLDEAHLTATSSVQITDQYVKVSGGRPMELLRSFDAIESQVETSAETTSNEELEKLEGKKVSFKWNADSSDYEVAYHETEGDEEVLERLAEDMDLRALLPDRSVTEGDKWEVDAAGLMSVVFAGMRLDKIDQAMEDVPPEMADVIEEMIGEVKRLGDDIRTVCEYKGSRDVDGKRCGAVAIRVEGKPSLDLVSFITNIVQKQGEQANVQIDLDVRKASLSLELNAEGELLWNLGDGHVHGFKLAPNLLLNADLDFSASVEGQEQRVEMSVEASATGEMTVDTE